MADEKLSAFLQNLPAPLHYEKHDLKIPICAFWGEDDKEEEGSSDDEEGGLFFNSIWVFWSEDDALTNRMIYNKIKSAFSGVEVCFFTSIRQFWAPVTIGGRLLLSTSDQPFSVSHLDIRLAKYRLRSMEFQCNIVKTNNLDIEHHPAMIISGAISRAFINRFPQILKFNKQGSLLERYALDYGLFTSYLLPIFCPSQSGSSCVGVVELTKSDPISFDIGFISELYNLKNKLEDVGLSVSDVPERMHYVDYLTSFETYKIILPQGEMVRQLGNPHKQAALDINELGDELDVINVDNSATNESQIHKPIKGKEVSTIPEALKEGRELVVENYLPQSKGKSKTTPILLSRHAIEQQFGYTMKEAAKNLNVSLSTLKRKSHDHGISEWKGPSLAKKKVNDSSNNKRGKNEEDNGVIQNPSAVNKNENSLIIKAEYAGDMIKFHLEISKATFVTVEKEIAIRFNLTIGTYKLKYLDEDEDRILLKCDEDMSNCIKSSRKLDRFLVRLFVQQST